MSKFFLTLLLLFSTLSSDMSEYWSESEEIELKRNEFYQKTIESGKREKKLFFRWVLYKNDGIVVHLGYDKFNYQFILYREYNLNSYQFSLHPRGGSKGRKNTPFGYLIFKDIEKDVAKFKLYIKM